jgi:hypothetical protein
MMTISVKTPNTPSTIHFAMTNSRERKRYAATRRCRL